MAEETPARRSDASIPMMPMTVSNSSSEKALRAGWWVRVFTLCVVKHRLCRPGKV